jgi:AcrR family transcriptional regulator
VTETRPLRPDAARKRAAVVSAAADELAELTGTPGGRLSLDQVAARAGVGVGTLYRHFPTREALLEAVYRHELDGLAAAAPRMAARGAADRALLRWMGRYLEFVESKRAMGDSLRDLVAAGAVTQRETRATLAAAVACFLDRGVEAGTFRPGIEPDDVVAAMAGAVIAAAGDDPRRQTLRLFALAVDGLRAPGA